MRSARWLLAGVALLIAVAIGAVWWLPAALDWNRYRATIAELASLRVGLPVKIDGPISLTVLPEPTLTAARVSLMGHGGTATARQLRLQVALGPLLAGRIEARDLVLRGLDVHLPWTAATGPGLLARAAPDWLSRVSARIEDGRIEIGRFVLADIDATLTTSPDSGSYRLAGTVRSGVAPAGGRTTAKDEQDHGPHWHFTARLTRPGGDGAVGLDLAVDGLGKLVGLGASLSARITRDGALIGEVSGRGPDLSALLPAPKLPFTARGRVNFAQGLWVADQLRGTIGGAPTTGAVALRLDEAPRLDVAMSTGRLDLDRWAPVLLGMAQTAGARASAHDMPISIDMSADAAAWGGGTLRRLRGAFDIADGRVTVREASAVLPGDAAFRLVGRLVPEGSATATTVRLDGKLSLNAPALRTTLAWNAGTGGAGTGGEAALVQAEPGLPPGALRSAHLSGHVTADADGMTIDRLTGTLDGGAVSGRLELVQGAQPLLRVGLSLGRLDLGSWWPATLPRPGAVRARLADVMPILAKLDPKLAVELKLRAAAGLLGGVTLAPLSFDLGIWPDRLVLHGARFGFDGLAGSLSGTLLADGRIADARVHLQAAHANALPRLAPMLTADHAAAAGFIDRLMRAPIWLGPLDLRLRAAGTTAALAVAVKGTLGDLRIDARPLIDFTQPRWRWQGPVALRHPGAPRLASAFGLRGVQGWLGDGSFSFVSQVAASADSAALKDFTLTAGGLHATGQLDLRPGGQGPMLTGAITADQLPLPHLAFDQPLPIAALAGWRAQLHVQAGQVLDGSRVILSHASAMVGLADRTLRLDDLKAQAGGGALSLTASIDGAADSPLLALRGRLVGATLTGPLFGLPLDLAAGTLDVKLTLAAHGYSPAALLAGLGGTCAVVVRGGALVGLDLPAVVAALDASAATGNAAAGPALDKALAGGSMGFDTLELQATLAQGVARIAKARVQAPSGRIDITGQVSLPDSRLDLQLQLRPKLATTGATLPPVIGLRITGAPAKPARAPQLADVIRWQAARGH